MKLPSNVPNVPKSAPARAAALAGGAALLLTKGGRRAILTAAAAAGGAEYLRRRAADPKWQPVAPPVDRDSEPPRGQQ